MTIAQQFAAKASVAFVAAAMIISLMAPAAQAQSADELQAMIDTLMAQIATLQGQVGQGGASVASGVCPYTWTRDLSTGSTGPDVMKLQQFLNADADTRVAAEGAGSVGMETEYFGPATAAAVSKMQVKYRAEILSPAGLVNPTGFFGPASRAVANSKCVAAPVVDDADEDMDDEDMTDDEDEDMDDEEVELSGEASLDVVEIRDGESDVEEGEEDVVVGELTLEFTEGDAEISRVDIAILEEGEDDTVGSGVAQPWDAFETFSLWVDGEMVAEVDASDEDDYLDEDDGTLRFTGLSIVGMEDEEVEILVGATVQNNLDADELADWSLFVTEVRYFDADGVATTDNDVDGLAGDEVGETGMSDEDSADFEVVVEGDGDELELRSSTEDPDETTIIADENATEDAMFFAFDLDASDSDGDVELNSIVVDIAVSNNASSSADGIDGLVRDFYIEIDGEEFSAESYTGTGLTAAVEFDIDGDYVVTAGERVTVLVYAEVEDMDEDSGYQGTTLNGSIDTTDIDAEAAEDITVGGSDTAGEFHPVRSAGISVEFDEEASDTEVNNNTVTFEFVVDITAVGEDQVIELADFNYSTTGPAASTPTIDVTIDATGGGVDEDPTDTFTLTAGQTATFTFKVFVTTLDSGDAGLYTVTLDDVDGTEVDETLDDVAQFSS